MRDVECIINNVRGRHGRQQTEKIMRMREGGMIERTAQDGVQRVIR